MVETHDSGFTAADVLRLFPTFVWKAQLSPELHRSFNADIVRTLDRMRQSLPALAPGQAWQSEQSLHRLGDFRDLVSLLEGATERVLDRLKVGTNAFEITALWANMNAPGARHPLHSHPNNFLSGVYYVQTAAGADTIHFHDPRSQTAIIRPPVTELTAENTDQVVVKVENGTLLVFPAWLPHSVDLNRSGQTRISLSFNIMFSAYAETLSKPLW